MNNVDYTHLIDQTGLKVPMPVMGGFRVGGFTTLASVINVLMPYIFYAGGIALLIYLVFGGFQLLLSRGDPKAVEGAKNKITGAVIGFVIMFVAYWLVIIIGKILGLDKNPNWLQIFS